MKKSPLALLTTVAVANLALAFAAPASPDNDTAISRWRELGFGMFIHYSMNTFTSQEYEPGDVPASTYAPSALDVDQWIRTARDAGMRYAVLTAKHTSGFCLWDSKVRFHGKEYDYDVASGAEKTDIVAAFGAACKKYNITPALYYCLLDPRNNSTPVEKQWRAGELPADFFQFVSAQLTELMQKYPEIGYYWIDIPRSASLAQRRALYDLIKENRRDTVVLFNHGTAKPTGPITIGNFQAAWPTDILNTELAPIQPGWFAPAQTWQGKTYELGYEHCQTISQFWFWKEGDRPRSTAELLSCYRQTRAAGGNLLLNVPPDRTGRIPDYHVKALVDLKKAIDANAPIANLRPLEWLTPIIPEKGKPSPVFPAPADGTLYFLRFGNHAYTPHRIITPDGKTVPPAPAPARSVLVAPFQQLWIDTMQLPGGAVAPGTPLAFETAATRDSFWDQVILANPAALAELPRCTLVETGAFASALPAHVRAINLTDAEVAAQRARLDDPVIPDNTPREISWSELEAAAWPLDFQKILLASANDANPGFAWQNGQWITTWPTRDPRLRGDAKEDHWFAPALLVGDTLIRPAPLSARASFLKTADGRTLPQLTLEWTHAGAIIRQTLFSHRAGTHDAPQIFVRFEIRNAPPGARLALGTGVRPNCHHWDNTEHPRTPALFFSLAPRITQKDRALLDADGNILLSAAQPFTLEPLGPLEKLLVFPLPADGLVQIVTPQAPSPACAAKEAFAAAEKSFIAKWTRHLALGAQVRLPDPQWMERIDIWRSQVGTITRVRYAQDDKPVAERLSYGAYFYQYYFGIEEAWPAISQAQWGRFDEARRQVEIMLRPDNLDKTNVHHQSRNGIAPLAAATVARLSRDRDWLARIAPAMLDCAQWTGRVRHPANDTRAPLMRGLLPPHIYGGDVRDPATSLYASAACWRGLDATAAIFHDLGTPELAAESKRLAAQAAEFRERIASAFREVTIKDSTPAFVPFAIAIPSLGGKNEGPHPEITATRYGNYWSLFAPSFLELGFRDPKNPAEPNASIFEYAARHGGHWAGLPRFYAGLDAAYMSGYIGWLIDEATRNPARRHQALASLQGFMLHGSSRNGHTIPEVAGLFPHRLQRAAFEKLTREAPWSFGMYDANRYLDGQISFTEPLGSVAGAALSLVRHALVTETDGGLMLFATAPCAWFAEGREIDLRDMPTNHGTLSVKVRSRITSAREVVMDYEFAPHVPGAKIKITARIAPPGEVMKEISFAAEERGAIATKF